MKPQGKLLDQIQMYEGAMGLVYERAIAYEKDFHNHDRHMLVCPRSSCRMDVVCETQKESFRIDSSKVLWVPAGLVHADKSMSAIYDTLALFPSGESFTQIFADNGLSFKDQRWLASRPILFKRTKWLDDILDRYFFERILNRQSPLGCTFFLEKQILNEVARIIFRDKLMSWSTKEDQRAGFEAALRFIETNLFSTIDLEQIATSAKISESTLLRSFKKEVGQTPYEYIKTRRLDEALALLKAGKHTIGDVALLVGYEDFSAFTRAFRTKFGQTPSRVASAEK